MNFAIPEDPSAMITLTGCRFADGSTGAVRIEAGRIAAIVASDELRMPTDPNETKIDAGGRLITPAFVDAHVHLDKTLWGSPWIAHAAEPSVASRIALERSMRSRIMVPVAARAANLLDQLLANGTTALRTHVDIDTTIGLAHLHAVLDVRERYRDRCTIQIVAFPQNGIQRDPGTAELLDAAIRAGADLVGGLDPIGIDADMAGHLDPVFAIAARHSVGVDIHLHDPGRTGYDTIIAICDRTRALGLGGRVTVSHAYCLGDLAADLAANAAESLARSGVAILTAAPGVAPMPPVKQLHQMGVSVCAGSDNIRDLWSPFGDGAMLERAMLVAFRAGFRRDEDLEFAFEMVSTDAAAALGLGDYGLRVGAWADLVALDAPSIAAAVVTRPRPAMVWRHGARR